MAYKTILVSCDTAPTNDKRIETAAELARASGAHLAGLFLRSNIVLPAYLEAGISPDLILLQENGERLQQPVNLEIYDATGAPVPFRDGSPRATIRAGELRLDHLTVGGYRFVLSRTSTRLERYADLLGGDEAQRIEWRLSIGGAGGEMPPNAKERNQGADDAKQDDEKREKGR